MKKKLQIFISSTYTDLLEERQSAVQAVLRAGNIPAGMELFSAGNKSQLNTIKKWIEESDIYVLILGGRYGSLETESQLSYTEIEYKYAIELGKPFFSLVLDDEMIQNKVKKEGQSVLELDNQDKYRKFKELVLSKVCRMCKDESEIKLAILESIIDIQNEFELTGWIKGDEIPDNSILLNEMNIIRTEKDELQKKVSTLEQLSKKTNKNDSIGDYSFDEIFGVLNTTEIIIPTSISTTGEKTSSTALKLFYESTGLLTTGVSKAYANDINIFYINSLIPIMLNFNLVERVHVRSTSSSGYEKFIISDLGHKFLSVLRIKNSGNK
jgi:hypothetical protein